MIKGMTGFGSAQFSSGRINAVVEVKSLNHRYFDFSCYLPSGFGSLENKIHQLTKKYIQRGRVTVSVKMTQKSAQATSLNAEAVEAYLRYAVFLSKKFRLENDLKLSDVIHLPGVLEIKETALEPEAVWPVLEPCLKKSFASLEGMRKREGSSLCADIADKLRRMTAQIKIVQFKSGAILQEKRKQLSVEEFKSFQKSSDINEELSRLIHYIQGLKELLKSSASVGKKADFIAQEMQREVNTLGAKLPDRVVTDAVVALKSKIEKIREQAQNIE